MNKIFLSSILVISLFFAQCKKVEVPDPVIGEPIFTLSGLVEQDSLLINAGMADYFMFTSTAPDQNGVQEFVGHLKPENCPDCGPALKIRFRDVAINSPQTVDINVALTIGNYAFFNNIGTEEIEYFAQFNASYFSFTDAVPTSYHWEFGDGNTSLLANPVHQYVDGSDRAVRLEIGDDQGYVSTYEKVISFDTAQVGCEVDFTIESVQNGFFARLEAMAAGTPPFSYTWSTGETQATIFHEVQADSFPFFHSICLDISDAMGCQTQRCRNVYYATPTGNILGYNTADFLVETQRDTTSQFDPLQFSTIIIEYTDDQGITYRSDLGTQQPGTHFFEVLSIEDFMDNPDGLPTKKLQIQFSCLVFTNNGEVLELNNVRSVFAIAYPQ